MLDLGGDKIRKRGQFNIDYYNLRVIFANLSTAKRPDVQADAAAIPFVDACFDAVICSELLEHVFDPIAVLEEAYRVLRKGGILLLCVPFLNRLHCDPFDFGRYTDLYWIQTLRRIGFSDIRIEKQGLFWSILLDMLRDFAWYCVNAKQIRARWARCLLESAIGWGRRRALSWEGRCGRDKHPFFGSYTTGFGILAGKN